MSKGIELSPKHGLNATIPICFWCGETKNEIALLGRMREKDPHTGKAVRGSDLEAPMQMVLDYEPCDKCREIRAKGFTLIEVSETPNSKGQPPIQASLYPTGRHSVIANEAAESVFAPEYLTKGILLLDIETYSMLIPSEDN